VKWSPISRANTPSQRDVSAPKVRKLHEPKPALANTKIMDFNWNFGDVEEGFRKYTRIFGQLLNVSLKIRIAEIFPRYHFSMFSYRTHFDNSHFPIKLLEDRR